MPTDNRRYGSAHANSLCPPPGRYGDLRSAARGDVYEVIKPRMAVEVLSKSNTGVPWDRKLNEYRRHQLLDYILLVDSALVAVTLYVRTATGWDAVDADRCADVIELPKIDCRLTLADIYDGTGLIETPPRNTDLVIPAP